MAGIFLDTQALQAWLLSFGSEQIMVCRSYMHNAKLWAFAYKAAFLQTFWCVIMTAILILIDNIVDIYVFTLLAYVIASWLVAFKIINPWQPFVRWILQSLGRLHEPFLSRIRSVLPDFGGIDLSPIIVLLAVQFGRNLLFEYAT